MNWRLIFMLSLFGLFMGPATVYFIPSNIEPFCWLAIFAVCAYIIAARVSSRYFLHGFMVSIFNSVWITAAHVLLYAPYVANHAKEMEMMKNMAIGNPRVMMALTGPVVGIVSGLVLGLFAWIASKLVKKQAV